METRINNLDIITTMNYGEFYFGTVRYLYKNELDALPQNKTLLKGIKI